MRLRDRDHEEVDTTEINAGGIARAKSHRLVGLHLMLPWRPSHRQVLSLLGSRPTKLAAIYDGLPVDHTTGRSFAG